jgi:hypothetical protein
MGITIINLILRYCEHNDNDNDNDNDGRIEKNHMII